MRQIKQTDPNAKTIWCLFSVDNNYDQPDYNLVAWWSEKPSLEKAAKALQIEFPGKTDEETLFVVNVWKGEKAKHPRHETSYRIVEVEEGVL